MLSRRDLLKSVSAAFAFASVAKTADANVKSAAKSQPTITESGLLYYKPLDKMKPFHSSNATYRLCTGGNRSGTSLAAAVETAVVATRKNRHPANILCLGYDSDHIGRNIYRLLFNDGAFMLADGQPAPPLIPKHLIQEIHWWNQSQRWFKRVVLKNGTTIYAESSKVDPACGTQWDFVWIDNCLDSDVPALEAATRMIDRGGKMVWSGHHGYYGDFFRSLRLRAWCGDPVCHSTIIYGK